MGSSEPSVGATTAPTQEAPTEEPPVEETPVEEPPVEKAPVTGPSCSDTTAPMETGGAGDGQSWAKQVETSSEAEFRWARPLKHPHSQSRRREMGLALPFPLQDTEGKLTSIERLYEYTGEQPPPRDDVAGRAIRHLHPEILPSGCKEAQKPGGLHDHRMPPYEQRQSLSNPVPGTPGGSKTFAACHKDVCVQRLI